MIMQKNNGKFYMKNIKLNFSDPNFDIEKEKEVSELSTFRLSPNLLVDLYI